MQNPLAFQPVPMQNSILQQFLMWRQNQLNPQPQPQPQPQSGQPNQGVLPKTGSDTMTIGNGGYIINVTMNASTGHKIVISASADTTIEDLLLKYTNRIGLPPNVIGKDIMFLYNGAQLDFKCQTPIGSLFRNTAVITVYDLGGIIGA